METTTQQSERIARQAARTQNARRNYWSAVAGKKPAWLINAQKQALGISEASLAREAGSPELARAAEVAYIESLTER